MCELRCWRELLAKANPALVQEAINDLERQAKLRDPAFKMMMSSATPKDLTDPARATWLFAAEGEKPDGLHHMVLGWNTVAVFVPVSQGFWLDFLLCYKPTLDTFPPVASKTVEFKCVEQYGDWVFFRPKPLKVMGKVATFNATSCSVSVIRERTGTGPLVFAHLDAKPPIPFGLLGEIWHANGTGGHFDGIASVSPYADDVAKFTKGACFGKGRTFPLQLTLLLRGNIGSSPGDPMENHTEFSLDLAKDHHPFLRAFMGFKENQFPLLFPAALNGLLDDLSKTVSEKELRDRDNEIRDRLFNPLMSGKYGNSNLFIKLVELLYKAVNPTSYPHIEALKRLKQYLATLDSHSDLFHQAMREYQAKVVMTLKPEAFAYLRQ